MKKSLRAIHYLFYSFCCGTVWIVNPTRVWQIRTAHITTALQPITQLRWMLPGWSLSDRRCMPGGRGLPRNRSPIISVKLAPDAGYNNRPVADQVLYGLKRRAGYLRQLSRQRVHVKRPKRPQFTYQKLWAKDYLFRQQNEVFSRWPEATFLVQQNVTLRV